jgi:putative addiction module component (TIGR02574 family)
MPPTMKELGIDRLSIEDRIALAQEIWDSIAVEPNRPPLLSEALRRELERRVAEADASPDDVVPWEEVLAKALARFRK